MGPFSNKVHIYQFKNNFFAEIEAIPFKILSKTSLMSLQKYRSSYKFSDNEFKREKQLSKK